MISEHRERGKRQPVDERSQLRLAARMRQEVAGDRDEIRPALRRPVDRALDCVHPARRDAEVEVGQMRDAEAVELHRQAR